jgi:hypothetical protein
MTPDLIKFARECGGIAWKADGHQKISIPVSRWSDFASRLLATKEAPVAVGLLQVQEADCVPHIHPQYGSGLFFTEDAILASPQARARLPSPVAVERLSDAEIEELWGEANRGYCIERNDYFKAFRDAEKAHGIGTETAVLAKARAGSEGVA